MTTLEHGELEQSELLERNLSTASHLLSSATAFFFMGFLFAYTYLRSLNSNKQWHPQGVHPPLTLASMFAALLVAGAILSQLARHDARAAKSLAVTIKLGAALACGLAALAVQLAEWATLPFGPNSGGYASVFVGWTGFYLLFVVLALYWLEIVFASSLRRRGEAPIGLTALSSYWAFLALLGLVTWIVLDLIGP